MSATLNVLTRNAYTALLDPAGTPVAMSAEQASRALFGWVYKQPGMPTINDCQRILEEVRSKLGDSATNKLLKKHHCKTVKDIWPGMWEVFFKDAEALLDNEQCL